MPLSVGRCRRSRNAALRRTALPARAAPCLALARPREDRDMGLQGCVLVGLMLALIAGCGDIYEGHRGKFPANYKEKIRAVIESKWPEPRMFRVLAISTPSDGFVLTTEVFP